LEPGIPNCRLVFSKHKLFLTEGKVSRTTHLTIWRACFQLSDVQVYGCDIIV
jgi:hypothetical protein